MKRLGIVALALVAVWITLSVVFLWPPVCRYAGASGTACLNELRQIDAAKQQWALETRQTNGTRADPALLEKWYLHGRRPSCPSGGTYTYGLIGQNPACSLGSQPAPPPVKERVGLLGWRWQTWPSPGPQAHTLPNH